MRELKKIELNSIQGGWGGILGGNVTDAMDGFLFAVPAGMTLGAAVAWKWASAGGLVIANFTRVIGQLFGLGGGAVYGIVGFLVGYDDVLSITKDWMNYIFQGEGGGHTGSGGIS